MGRTSNDYMNDFPGGFMLWGMILAFGAFLIGFGIWLLRKFIG